MEYLDHHGKNIMYNGQILFPSHLGKENHS